MWRSLLLVFLSRASALAQQAIVNMPSADITPKGKYFLMHETQARAWRPGRSWSGTNFFAYGAGKSTELAITSYSGGSPLAETFSTGFGFKSAPQFWKRSHPELEAKLTVGQMAIVNHRGLGFGSFSYAHGSFRIPRYHTRISAGGWGATRQLVGRNTGGYLLGAEHPFGKRWILLGEWFSGRHDFGFFIPGVLFHPTKNQIVVVGWKIPTYAANGKSGLVLEYGITFGNRR